MVSKGYQRDDALIIDYDLWRLPGTDLDIRGPMSDVNPGHYFTALGAAQTFGRFVERTYPRMISEATGIPHLNLGVSGAGPTFFTDRPELMDYINKSQFVIVQMMSGRSVSNSKFDVQTNQGLVKPAGKPGAKWQFAEDAYIEVVKHAEPEELVRFRAEIRARYIAEMSLLLKRISVPKILLYWSARQPDYQSGFKDITEYWGGFPHFVDAQSIEALKPLADDYAEVAGAPGLPQQLRNRNTREPVVVWPEDRFPNVVRRDCNYYYPSPEMHEEVAAAVLPKVPPRRKPPAGSHKPRDILVHMHIFKNAGTSVDVQLARQLGDGLCLADPASLEDCLQQSDLLDIVRKDTRVRAISSHQMRFPLTGNAEVTFHPFLFLRHPLDRAESIYEFERSPQRQKESNDLMTQKAAELSFPDYVNWSLDGRWTRAQFGNYQTRVCSLRYNGTVFDDWRERPTAENLSEALAILAQLPFVGIVDAFTASAARFNEVFFHAFDGLRLCNVMENVSRSTGTTIAERLRALRERLGQATYERLLVANELDLELYQMARRRLGI